MLDESGKHLTNEFFEEFRDNNALSLENRDFKELFKTIQHAFRYPSDGAEFGLKTRLCEALHKTLKNMGANKRLLRKCLIEDHLVNNFPLLASLSERLAAEDVSKGYRRFIMSCSTKWFKEYCYIFEDITRCEDFVATLDSVLMFLYKCEGEHIKNACSKLPLNIEDLKAAYSKFDSVSSRPTTGTVAQRYDLFLSNFDAETKEQFVEWLLHLHEQVVTSRGGLPWIEVINGKIAVHTEYFAADELQVTPGKGWRYPYYLDALASVYKGLR
ncbi:MAG TPA: hypothetical protein VJ184_11210 [Chryseolinea sp.]|nr:hypothetical protein [Chryseolinea sp.]